MKPEARIRNTPLIAISFAINNRVHRVNLKLESKNPTGSSKDRTAFALISDLESRRLLSSSTVIIESTSGNLGAALSWICHEKGYPLIAVVDPKITVENLQKMRSLGARIERVTESDASGGHLHARIQRVRHLCSKNPNYIWPDQYSNPANPYAHYSTTGPEIYRQMACKVSAVFIAISTGGTLAGVARYFREKSPKTKIIGVDAIGSVAIAGVHGPRRLTGIGSARKSNFIRRSNFDLHIAVRDEEAFLFCRYLFASTGLKLGGSAGAVLAACARYLEANYEIDDVVCLCADGGENYDSTIYSDVWLARNGIVLPTSLGTVEEITYPALEVLGGRVEHLEPVLGG